MSIGFHIQIPQFQWFHAFFGRFHKRFKRYFLKVHRYIIAITFQILYRFTRNIAGLLTIVRTTTLLTAKNSEVKQRSKVLRFGRFSEWISLLSDNLVRILLKLDYCSVYTFFLEWCSFAFNLQGFQPVILEERPFCRQLEGGGAPFSRRCFPEFL